MKKIVREYEDRSWKTIGIPDRPYSLMEGMIGEAILYFDIVQAYFDPTFVPKFPGFEI